MSGYEWANGARIAVDAEVAGQALDAMVKEYKSLTPALVVNESRPVAAPLHPAFEWNDPVAAERYRETQASYLLRSLVLSSKNSAGEDVQIRKFANVAATATGQPQRVYIDMQAAMLDDVLRKQILEDALGELRAFRRKYARLAELAKIFQSITEIEQQLAQGGDTDGK